MRAEKDLGLYLVEQGKIDETTLHTAREQQNISQEPLGNILVSNGFITQKDKIHALRTVDIDQLAEESLLITQCPPQVLLDTQTMILVEDRNEVYIASLQDREDVEFRLAPYYQGFKFVWNPVDIERLDSYLQQIESISRKNVKRDEWMIREGLMRGASDIHIEPRGRSYSIFFRIDGALKHIYEGTLEEYGRLASRIKQLSNMDQEEKRVPQDGGYSVEHHGRNVDLRVATTPTTEGEKVVIRILDPENTESDLRNIGISRLSEWEKGIYEPHGICLVCGPTGSGKTTTLNATVRSMDRFGKSIYTIEDPVEYNIPYVSQVNTNPNVGMDFARGLKAMMRMDPDVIVIGEIRDIETAQIAIKAAETGHLVLSTIHTGSIEGALERLRDIGVDPNDIKNILRSVMVQRLVKRTCAHCQGKGCEECEDTGKKGRVLVSEVNYFEDAKAVMSANEGNVSWPTMIDDLMNQYEDGLITRDEVINQGVQAQKALEAQEASHANV